MSSRSTSPRRRRQPDELRARTIDAAVDLLLETGGANSFAHMRLEDAIVRSGIPRASAYRAWGGPTVDLPGDKPQARFEAGVARELARRAEVAGKDLLDKAIGSLEHLLPTLGEPGFSARSPEERAELILELFRVAGNVAYGEFSTDPIWQVHVDAVVTTDPLPPPTGDTGTTPGMADRRAGRFGKPVTDRLLGFLTELNHTFGVRLQPGMRLEHLGLTAVALATGMGMQAGDESVPHPKTDAGKRWSPLSMALVGLYATYFENDPDNGPDCVVPHCIGDRLT